jgi:hypothetical protein
LTRCQSCTDDETECHATLEKKKCRTGEYRRGIFYLKGDVKKGLPHSRRAVGELGPWSVLEWCHLKNQAQQCGRHDPERRQGDPFRLESAIVQIEMEELESRGIGVNI